MLQVSRPRIAWACLWVIVPSLAAGDDRIDFGRQIRPILSDRCFHCHGPDDADREADLRFDQRESATRKSEYGEREYVIKPGSPDESELLLRLTTSDPDLRMPPPDSHLRVSEDEVALFNRWITEGANWTGHWAFEPIAASPPPVINAAPAQVNPPGWARNEIDHFVLAHLEEHQLAPAARAPRELLARRLYFDLIGLPPTVAELDAFLQDSSPHAYESLVDRLLASPRYGERMAVDWLDVARYSDTHGYQLDFESHVWPYRDWVIRAFNDNLPYDQFITWQLAGDLLPEATRDQQLATAFNRLHRQTNEGGSVAEEFRLEYVADRVDTFGVAFLGLSIGCARCHDHKFDPISQREYYELSAFFDNIDEHGVFSYFTKATPSPALDLPTEDQANQLALRQKELAAAEQQLTETIQREAVAFETWLTEKRPQLNLHEELTRGLIGDFPLDEIEPPAAATAEESTEPSAARLINRVDESRSANVAESPALIDGFEGQGVLLNGDNGFTTDVTESFSRHTPFTIALWLQSPAEVVRGTIWHTTQASADAGHRGMDLVITDGHLEASLVHYWPGNALRIRTKAALPVHDWVHVAVRYEGGSRAEDLQLLVNGAPAAVEVIRDGLTRTIRHTARDSAGGAGHTPHHLTVGYRYRDRGLAGGVVDELKVYDRPLSEMEVRLLAAAELPADVHADTELSDATREDWRRIFLWRDSPAFREAWQMLSDARRAAGDAAEAVRSVMVMQELPQPRQTFLLERGAYDAKGEAVHPGIIREVLPWDESWPRNRLGLARWLTDADHPLTARVAVNRIWQSLMGRGLVPTQEDFGSQGVRPSHPDLLDYLSRDFVTHGWNVKRLVKQIVMSATYQQSAEATAAFRERDPDNALLARGPARRLAAEMIRDGVLAASGLLVQQLGGPPVKPYQPPGLWQESMNIAYQRDPQAGSRRRSLYSYWKRTLPPPAMITFDAAKREMCEVRRHPTTTPLQALVLLNDPQYVEAARVAAERAMQLDEDDQQRIARLYRSFTSRQLTAAQQRIFTDALNEQLTLFRAQPDQVDAFLAIGDHRPLEDIDRPALASLTVVAQMMMNLDHFLMLR